MCQQILLCPEVQVFFNYTFPFMILLLVLGSIWLIMEIMKTYSHRKRQRQQTIQVQFSILAQAQEIVENTEKQLLDQDEKKRREVQILH